VFDFSTHHFPDYVHAHAASATGHCVMADRKAVDAFLVMLFAHGILTAALRQPQASTSNDELHRQATTAPAKYVIGGGYRTPSGRSAEMSCDAVGLQPVTTFEECQAAAEQVGISITEVIGPGSWRHVPYGCSVQQGIATPESGALGTNGRVHFSTTPGSNNGGKGGYVLICKKQLGRIAVFSAQFGGRDHVGSSAQSTEDLGDAGLSRRIRASNLTEGNFENFPKGVDAFLFTDMVNVVRDENSPWQLVYPARQYEEYCDDNILCLWKGVPDLTPAQKQTQMILASKFFKTRWIAESTQYDYIVWMDGRYVLKNEDLVETVQKYMEEGVDMLVMQHRLRRTVAEELGPACGRAALILNDRSVIKKGTEIYERYKREGFSDTTGLFDTAMFVVRPARVRDMFLDWWHEVQQGVPRDQISLPWMIQKHGINVSSVSRGACFLLGQHCWNPGRHK